MSDIGGRGKLGAVSRQIIALASRRMGIGKAGVVAAFNLSPNNASARLSDLHKGRYLIRAGVSRHIARYFTDQAHADAWIAAMSRPVPVDRGVPCEVRI